MIPEDCFYTNNHEWVRADDNQLEIGVTRPLLMKVGDLISLELLDADDEMKLELPFGEIEGSEAICKLYPPIEARIVEVNAELLWNLEKLKQDPYGEGWLIRVQLDEGQQLDVLQFMTGRLYEQYVQEQLGEEYLQDE